ncbi:MAG: polysaccharide deacetylase family protein [Bacillota bacterium]
MNTRIITTFTAVLIATLAAVPSASAAASTNEIQLITRGDDMGVCHTANEACIAAYRDGIVRSVEVIVPGQWFLEAAKMLNENPGVDVGVHLCLTSEWERVKWRPITHGKSLVDGDGYFYPMTAQRADFPPNTGFLYANPKLEEVESELRAQIELAKKHIKNITHLSVHMGTATASPALRQLTQRLAEEYKLPEVIAGARYAGFSGKTAAEKEASLLATLEKLQPGVYIMVEHPGFDTPDMRSLGHKGYWDVASDRDAVTRTFTSEKAKQVIKDRKIRVVSYGDVIRQGK